MGLLSGFGRWLGGTPALESSLRAAVERAVESVDPLLKSVSGYERRLAPAVSRALEHGGQLAQAIPGPIEVNARSFGSDPRVHALFAAPGDIAEMLGRSRELRDFLADPAFCECEDFVALLGMRRREKAVSGMARNGEVIQQGVPQRLLYFADHTLGELACSDADTRSQLQLATLDSLARGFAACVADLRRVQLDARTALQVERARNGRVERRQELEERQREAIASLAPGRLLEAYADWLATPQSRVFLRATECRIDRMGVIATDTAPDDGLTELRLPELIGRDRRQWTVIVARIRREDALEAVRRQEQANRYLII